MDNLIIENATIRYRNFSGRKTEFNSEGLRNFNVIIDDEDLYNKLIEDGWNVQIKQTEDGESYGQLKVAVSYMRKPPVIKQVTMRNGKPKITMITEETVGDIDNLDIKNIDLSISPSHWQKGGREGIKAYLKTMYYELIEDEFAHKYYDDSDDFGASDLPFET